VERLTDNGKGTTMTRKMLAAFMAATTLGATFSPAAQAQPWHREYRGDHHDRGLHRGERHWRNWGGRNGYDGYQGRWRTGQRFDNWRSRQYYVTDYRSYGLPAPRRGYRYYRDSNGDIVMAAIATGLIASILTANQ
jgi:Ni/Co efflux regulator RcnB